MNWRFKLSIRLALLRGIAASAVVLTGCAEGGSSPTSASTTIPQDSTSEASLATVATMIMTPTQLTLAPGATGQLVVVLKDVAGNVLPYSAKWTSSNTAVATVVRGGAVRGVAPGTATVSAKAGSQTATASITVTGVTPAPVPASITITPATSSIVTGASAQLSAVVKDAQGAQLTGMVITWATSAAALVTISTSGLASGVAAGTATITATVASLSATAQVTVISPPVPPPPSGGILVPNVFSNESFESGFGQLTSGGGATPTGVSRDGAHPRDGVFSLRRAVLQSQWAIASITAASPAVMRVPAHGLQNGARIGITGTADANLNADFYAYQGAAAKSRFAKVLDANYIEVYQDAALTIPVGSSGGSGGVVTLGDLGPTVWRFWPLGGGTYDSFDRVQFRFYFYFDGHGSSPFKFQIYEHGALSGEQFGGFYVISGTLRWYMFPEFVRDAQQYVNIAPMSALVNGWHSLEVDHRRNGGVNPEVRIWLDDVLVTRPSSGVVPAPATWNATTGVLSYGKRAVTTKIGSVNVLGIQNRGNTTPYNVWVDRLSLNTGDPGANRIGP